MNHRLDGAIFRSFLPHKPVSEPQSTSQSIVFVFQTENAFLFPSARTLLLATESLPQPSAALSRKYYLIPPTPETLALSPSTSTPTINVDIEAQWR